MTTLGTAIRPQTRQDRDIIDAIGGALAVVDAAWTTWAPTVSVTGGTSFTPAGSPIYKWRKLGKKIEYLIGVKGTIVGAVTAINLTVPAGAGTPAQNYYTAAILDLNGTPAVGKVLCGDALIVIQKLDGSAFAATAGQGIELTIVQAEVT